MVDIFTATTLLFEYSSLNITRFKIKIFLEMQRAPSHCKCNRKSKSKKIVQQIGGGLKLTSLSPNSDFPTSISGRGVRIMNSIWTGNLITGLSFSTSF